jgi:hypothetical protein
VILDDADFAKAIPLALEAGFANSGQACIAGTRILVPASRLRISIVAVGTGDARPSPRARSSRQMSVSA